MAKIPSTQQHLNIEDIVDDLVVLKNGVIALIMETSALNFDLLSPDEQDARIIAFANLLNGVDYPFQITIRTVRTDVSEYIRRLEDYKTKQISKSLIRQIEIYIQFIRNLTTKNEILDKRFFVTIPYRGSVLADPSLIKRMFGSQSRISNVQKIVQQAKIDLYPKRDNISRLFRKMGITARQLDNNELLMLFYEIYDPDKIGYQKLSLSIDEYTTGVVKPLRE
ncbi:MAG: hypothetical protein US52_C0003G0006 [candidate division WS6 bacterium GW2011_GWA2_37_6]|uniref:Uncharacterized protein n=1 Tax=candidate division WS6 bacterium GW2011_GWA2_37_6 TaxID=1619087 RepID=A0A0G0HCJ8_9BACT|nr:MAG: hypothetical protein US52_C0003G0006 [candidate division WS6 bacterium GW2011_GWA2_37_6]